MSAILEEGIGFDGKESNETPETTVSENKHTIPQKITGEAISVSKLPDFESLDLSKTPSKKSLKEAKNLLGNFKEKLSNYPHYMSHEGSTVLCVFLSINKTTFLNINSLPESDRKLIALVVPEKFDLNRFDVKFDDMKDFVLTFKKNNSSEKVDVVLFNTVIHPEPKKTITSDITSDDYINIDGQKFPSKQKLQRLAGLNKQESVNQERDEIDYSSRRQPVSGRNAYEIRADVLQMAIDWASLQKENYNNPHDVVDLAKEFYRFVENKR